MKPTQEQLVAVLEAARCEPIGLTLFTNNPTAARAALYRARMRENNPAYSDLQFRMWPGDDGDLVICHGTKAPEPKPNNFGSIDLSGVLDLDMDAES